MNIKESQLVKLLTKAYEEGWCGSKDLSEEVATKIMYDFQNMQKGQQHQTNLQKMMHAEKESSRKSRMKHGYHIERRQSHLGRYVHPPLAARLEVELEAEANEAELARPGETFLEFLRRYDDQ